MGRRWKRAILGSRINEIFQKWCRSPGSVLRLSWLEYNASGVEDSQKRGRGLYRLRFTGHSTKKTRDCKDGDGADRGRRGGTEGERPRAISRLIAQVLQVHPISHSRNTMEMDRSRNRCRFSPSLSLFRFVATRDRCKESVREQKREKKKERKMNRRNCEKSIIEVAS